MAKKKETVWKVTREYKNLYSTKEFLRSIIQKHLDSPRENTNQMTRNLLNHQKL